MAAQTVYACDIPLDASGVCLGNSVAYTIDTDLATALTTHATALDNNTAAMNSFFTLSSDDVALISAGFFVIFIIGNTVGRMAKIMRKA